MNILGFKEPYNEIRFGPFTGNGTLIKWFTVLNEKFAVNGNASIFYKPVGKNKTFGMTSQIANQRLECLLHSKNVAFIYHCYNHYICPVGYENEPQNCTDILNSQESKDGYLKWIILADTSRKYPSFHCVKWEDIDKDLNTKSPEFLNIRHLERGVQIRECKQNSNGKSKSSSGNLHCIIKFESNLNIEESTVIQSNMQANDLNSLIDSDDSQDNDDELDEE